MRKLIVDIIAGLFILLFVYAAVSKFLDYEKFRVELGKSPVLTSVAGLVAWGIPTLELIISLVLFLPTLRLIALYASFSLMTIFTAYIIAIIQFSYYIPCSCGGVLQKLSWNTHIIFNAFFILLGIVGVLLEKLPLKQIKS